MVEQDPAFKKAETNDSTELIIDISTPHPIEQQYIDQFPDQPELQSLHCVMTFGLIARDCKIPYITMNPELASSRYCDNPLTTFSQLLERVRIAGQAMRGEVEDDGQMIPLWGDMYRTMLELRVVDPSRPALSERLFDEQLQRGIKRNNDFIIGRSEDNNHTQNQREEKLRNIAHDVRTASELLVCGELKADDINELINRAEHLDKDLWADFSDEYYWRGNDPFRALPSNLRSNKLIGLTLNMRYAHRTLARR